MFNFDNVENVTNKQVELSDVKLFAGNKIRLGIDAVTKLGLNGNNTGVIIQKAGDTFIIAGCVAEAGNGREVNKKGEFTHQGLHKLLGGWHTEYSIVGDGQ